MEAELDFAGLDWIGRGFAHQIFVVRLFFKGWVKPALLRFSAQSKRGL